MIKVVGCKCKPKSGGWRGFLQWFALQRLRSAVLDKRVSRTGIPQFLSHPPGSQNVVDEVSKEVREQQTSDATNPEEEMLGQLWGIDFLLVHD
jgi:hypothetical protein